MQFALPRGYHGPVAPHRSLGANKTPSPKRDRLIAMIIWVVIGLLIGLAIGVFTGSGGWVWLSIGFLAGLLAAFLLTRPHQQIEED